MEHTSIVQRSRFSRIRLLICHSGREEEEEEFESGGEFQISRGEGGKEGKAIALNGKICLREKAKHFFLLFPQAFIYAGGRTKVKIEKGSLRLKEEVSDRRHLRRRRQTG